jgi:hypothetical protein
MRTRLSGVLVALAIALVMPTAALAANPPVAVYHGTWNTAGWVAIPGDFCPFPPEVTASGNWNVTILPDGKTAVVHITMFTLMPVQDTDLFFRLHVGSWGGNSFGQFWTVDPAGPNVFALHMDMGAPAPSYNTFVFDGTNLTFAITPWTLPETPDRPAIHCSTAVAVGTVR